MNFCAVVTGFVAPPRHTGATPRGARRFYPPSAALSKALGFVERCFPMAATGCATPGWRLGAGRANYPEDRDGAFIYVRYAGMRHGPPEVLARLAQGETVDPGEYYFRVAPMFETGAERYAWLNKILAVGVGDRLPPNDGSVTPNLQIL